MTTVNIEDLQPDLAKLIDQAAAGEPLLIARAGKPLVTIEPVAPESELAEPVDTSKRFGFLAGQFTIPEDFDTWMQDEIIEMFVGRPDKFAFLDDLNDEEKAILANLGKQP